MILSIAGKDLNYWIAPESFIGRCRELLGLTDLGRRSYFFTAVHLRRDSVVKLDNLMWALMAKVEGTLDTKYSSVIPGGPPVRGDYLEEVLGSPALKDTIHDLRFRFSKGRVRVHLILSKRKVQLRFIGGPEHESLKRSLAKSIKGVIVKKRAPFLKHLFFLTVFMLLAFGVMWAGDLLGAARGTKILLSSVATLSTFVLLPLLTVHNRGVYLPHTTIMLAQSRETKKKWLDAAPLINLTGILVDAIKIVIDLLRLTYAATLRFTKAAIKDQAYGEA
jgi:hypothetical protein